MRRFLTGLLCASLVFGACGDDTDDERASVTSLPTTTSSEATTTTSSPPVPAPDVIPQDVSLITEEYVEQVLNALFEVDLQATKIARMETLVGSESIDLLNATSSREAAITRINDLVEIALDGFVGMPEDVSAWIFEVVEVRVSDATCIVSEVRSDSTGLFPSSDLPEGTREFVRLRPATPEQLSTGLNPTAWVVDDFPVTMDGSTIELTCDP